MNKSNLLACGLVSSLFVASATKCGFVPEQECTHSRGFVLGRECTHKVHVVGEKVSRKPRESGQVEEVHAKTNAAVLVEYITDTEGVRETIRRKQEQDDVNSAIEFLRDTLENAKEFMPVFWNGFVKKQVICGGKSLQRIHPVHYEYYVRCNDLYHLYLYKIYSKGYLSQKRTPLLYSLYHRVLKLGLCRCSEGNCECKWDVRMQWNTNDDTELMREIDFVSSAIPSEADRFRVCIDEWKQYFNCGQSVRGASWAWTPDSPIDSLTQFLIAIQASLAYLSESGIDINRLGDENVKNLSIFLCSMNNFYRGDVSLKLVEFSNLDFGRLLGEVENLPNSVSKKIWLQQSWI